MKAVQILMEEELIDAVDREAKRLRSDRSKLVRAALTQFLAESRTRALEERHRKGYEKKPQRLREVTEWETAERWPED